MTCDCLTYQGITIHFDDCPALQAAIFKHRQAVESMIQTNMVKHGVSVDQLNTREQTEIPRPTAPQAQKE